MGWESGPSAIVCVVARLDSRRLPSKVLSDVSGRPLIHLVTDRASRISPNVPTVVATTSRSVDDPIEAWAQTAGVEVFRGRAEDVTGRLIDCASTYQVDYLIRANADSPFLDPELVRAGLAMCEEGPDLVSNIPGRSFPYGISVEIIKVTSLMAAWFEMTDLEREHVSPYIYEHSDNLQIASMISPRPDLSTERMVVDYAEDLERLRKVVTILQDSATTAGFIEAAQAYRRIGEET